MVVDVSTVPWAHVVTDDGVGNVVHRDLLRRFVVDRASWGGMPAVVCGIDAVGFDLPGLHMHGQPSETVVLDGLRLTIPCHDVPSLWASLVEHEAAAFADGTPHHVVEGDGRRLVLLPRHKELLEALLWALSDRAGARAEAAWAKMR